MSGPLVSTKEVDYLDEDKPIRGQNYVCLSFISPEDLIRNKEVFYLEKYLEKFSSDLNGLYNGLSDKYPEAKDSLKQIRENYGHLFSGNDLQEDFKFFKSNNSGEVEKEYLEKNDFQTSIRGIKVRGTYETQKEAQTRAELLRRMGDKFNIFVAQVGVWCPWSPNPEEIQEQEYAETQLNTLMKGYRENMEMRDQFYEQRKEEKIKEAQEQLKNALEKKDPWLEGKETENEIIKTTIVEEEGEGEGEGEEGDTDMKTDE